MSQITKSFHALLQEMMLGVEQPTYKGLKLSWGHIGFLEGREYYLRNGTLYSAPVESAFDFETGARWGEKVAKGKAVNPYIASLRERGMAEG